MKKSLVALAALAVVGTASAQSSVTMFGILDAGISSSSNKSEDKNVYFNPFLNQGNLLNNPLYWNRGTVTKSQTGMTNSGNASSRLGFRGTEDLGGGLAASFWLEAALGNDTGTAGGSGAPANSGLFNRRSTVSLSGNFGEIRLGRDYTPSFFNDTVFDPFGTVGVGASLPYRAAAGAIGDFAANPSYVRANNAVQYFLPPNLGGFYGQLMYAFHENAKYDPGTATPDVANNSRTGRYAGGRFGYANGPLDVAFAYGSSTIADQFYAGNTSNMNTWNLGGSYDLGSVKLFAEYTTSKVKTDSTGLGFTGNSLNDYLDYRGISNPSVKGWLIGATVPVGPGLIRVSYGSAKYDNDTQYSLRELLDPYRCVLNNCDSDPKANQFAVGYVHNLSKRTALYATVARISNKNGAGLAVNTLGLGSGYAARSADITYPGVGTIPGVGLTPKSSMGYDVGIRHSF